MAKIKIIEKVNVVKEIDVELPYYYEQDLSGELSEYIIYGKIEEKRCVTILHSESFSTAKLDESYQIEIKEHESISDTTLGLYFKDIHKSNKESFDSALSGMIDFINKKSK